MTRRTVTDPSRHTRRQRSTRAKSRRVGPSETELRNAPREHGSRTVQPKQPRAGQPPGHVGHR